MATEMVWNDADPPADAKDHAIADFLVTAARKVRLQKITPQNRGEWLWRWAFLKAMKGYSGHDPADAAACLSDFLDRFCGATFQGRVRDCNRGEFLDETVEEVVNAAQKLADIAIEENLEFTVKD